MKAYRHLVKYCLDNNCVVSVWDGEEWQVKRSNKSKEITDAIESVDEAQIKIYDTEGKTMGWALTIAYGVDDDETVADHTMTEFMDQWWEQYMMKIS